MSHRRPGIAGGGTVEDDRSQLRQIVTRKPLVESERAHAHGAERIVWLAGPVAIAGSSSLRVFGYVGTPPPWLADALARREAKVLA
jgi:hypothetical protein